MDHHHRSTKLHTRTRSRTSAAPKSVSRYDDDDVFDSAAFLSPSEEVYREIFAGFHGGFRGGASAIPVLDLPPVDENEAVFDFRFFDYSEVFGGFEGMVDYAVPFHQLFRRFNGGYASSDGGSRTPVETDCLSEEWDVSSYSSRCKSLGNESSQLPVDDGKLFNVSYQRNHQPNEGVSNTAHVAPVHAVPGYAFVIDQIPTPQKTGLQNPQLLADDNDDKLIKRGKQEEKLAAHHETVEHEKVDLSNGCDEMYVTISEINLRTQPNDGPPPSRPPPIFDANYGEICTATSSVRANGCGKHFSGSISGNDSPPFVDVEVDGRFSAADFAPSMTESVKNSQATLKNIQENLQYMTVVMRQVNVCAHDETENNVVVRKSHNSCDDIQHPSKRESNCTSISAQSSPDVMGQNPILNLSRKTKSKQSSLLEDSCDARSSGEWSEVPEFIELVQSEKTKTRKQKNGESAMLQNIIKEGVKEEMRIPKHEHKINKRVTMTSNKSENHVKISEVVREVITQDEKCKEVFVSLQTTHQCKDVERKVYEEDQQMEDDIFIDIIKNELDIDKELNKLGPKVKFDRERMEVARKLPEVGPEKSFIAAQDDRKIRKTCETRLINLDEQAHGEDVHSKQQNEREINSNIFVEKQLPSFKNAFVDEENIKNQKKSDEKDQKEERLKKSKSTSWEISEKEEYERRKKEEEYVAKLMEASENEAEDMLKEALEEVNKRILMEDFERAEREKKMNNDAEQPQNQESSDHLSRSSDMIFELNDEKEAEAVEKILGDPNVMTGTNEQHSATLESTAQPNRTSVSSNSSDEASLHEDTLGVRTNHKVPHMIPDSRNLHEKVKVGKVTMLENAQAQTKVASQDGIGTYRETANSKRSESLYISDRRKQTYNLSGQSKTSQIVGGKENFRNDGIASGERAKLERERRAREIELERLREMEEEWEREREREKDRVAFESVTRNVQGGGFGGLHERAAVNVATIAEARQKDLANARERLEKSCLEAKEKSFSEKISMEAMMRQDQSEVKRANGEARECADRSISYGSGMYPSTSIRNANGGLEGESAQRCKARLERQQRTAERAAKALAEKNTRDVIAQREQAERHRLAESLDAEVKRWANGKQGNLRALLSTLQYILGAESGWQPVPLTDIITSVAVKKAYRKATLCVHPDKLQQRRATIQQRYICEKVFDLLKDAWNRFNSEER